MRIRATLRQFSIDMNSYRRELHREMDRQIKEAARAWLHAVVAQTPGPSGGKVPIWSGASAATFSELAAAVAFPLGITPSGTAPNRISLGTKHGEGELVSNVDNGYRFRYRTTLEHLIFNEFNNANKVGFNLINPGPYDFQGKGKAAFENVAQDARLPNPYRHIRTKTFTV